MNQNVSITGSANSVMVSGGGDVYINVNGHGLRMNTLTEQPTFRMLRVALIDGGKEQWVGNLIQQPGEEGSSPSGGCEVPDG